MRYFECKQSTQELVDSSNLSINYIKQIKDVLSCSQAKSVESFLRLSDLFKKINSANTDDILEIEDQDYSFIKETLSTYITKVSGMLAQSNEFTKFIKYLSNLPETKPLRDPVEQVLQEIKEGAI